MRIRFSRLSIAVLTLLTAFILNTILFPPQPARAVDGEIVYTGTNTGIYGDDGHSGSPKGSFPLGFTFNFYGTEFTQANVNINGALTFGGYYTNYANQTLDNPAAQANSIFPFWDDLTSYAENNSAIYYATIGEAPNRMFVMQWTNMYFWSTTVQMGTFQTILYEGSNDIQLQYRDLLGGNRALGNDATIGIKKDNSTYSQYSAFVASLTQGQAIRYAFNGVNNYTVNTNASYELVYLAPEGAPTSPVLVNPPNGTTGITTTPTFEWLPVEAATSYIVLISTVSNFSSTVVNQSGITDTSYIHGSALNENTQYYWRVQAVNQFGSSLSSTRTFTTGVSNAAPNTPTNVTSSTLIGGNILDPFVDVKLNATLTDPDDDEQLRYRIQIATDASFNSLVIDYRSPFGAEGNVTYSYGESGGTYLVGTSATVLEPDDYYLRIRAEDDAAGSSAWYTASGIAFTIPIDLTPPVISSVALTPNNASVIITWLTNENASSQIEYGLIPTYGSQTSEINTITRTKNHSVTITDLKPCARYFFITKSRDANNNVGQSTPQQFATSGCTVSSIITGSENTIPTPGGGLGLTNGTSTTELIIPTGFYSESVKIQINQLDAEDTPEPPANTSLAGDNFFDLIAVSDSGDIVDTFDEAVTFVITYGEDLEDIFIEATLNVYKYTGDEWVLQNCVLDTTANTLTCTLSGFSVYALFGETVPEPTPTPTPTPTAVVTPTPTPTPTTQPDQTPSVPQTLQPFIEPFLPLIETAEAQEAIEESEDTEIQIQREIVDETTETESEAEISSTSRRWIVLVIAFLLLLLFIILKRRRTRERQF